MPSSACWDWAVKSSSAVVETDPVTPPNRLSASSTLSYEQCPAKFYFAKIAKLPEESGKEAMLGNFVHEVLQALYEMPSEARTIESGTSLLRQYWDRKWRLQIRRLRMSQEEEKAWRWQAYWCVEELFKMEKPKERTFEGLEKKVTGKIGDTQFLGFVDRYHREDALVVGDYKTGKHDPRFVDDKVFQMGVYAILGEQTFDEPVSHAELIFLKSGDLFRIETDKRVRQQAEDKVQTVVDSLAESASTGKFETHTSRLCDWCSFKSVCPAWQ